MWVSSFVMTLPPDPTQARAIQEAVRGVPVFESGQPVGQRLPVVLEAADGATARYWHRWIEELPGVVHVEVAFLSFDDDQEPDHVLQTVAAPAPAANTR